MIRFIRALLALCLLTCAGAFAQGSYPNKPIRVVVPYAAGGAGDLIGRTIGAKLTEAWQQQVLLDNRPGGGGNIGTELVARAPADGYTLLLATDIQMSINPHLFKQLPYNPETDFAPVIQSCYVAFVLAANPSIQADTLPDLVKLLKARPGALNYASAGAGSTHHLTMEWLKSVAGVNVVHVPYKGSGQIIPDLVSGNVQLAYMGFSPAMPHIKAGKLKAIAVGTTERLQAAPAVPTIGETYPGVESSALWSFFAPAGTPRDIVAKLNAEMNRIQAMPDVRERFLSQGLYIVGGSPEDLAARTRSDLQRWGKVIKTIGLKPE